MKKIIFHQKNFIDIQKFKILVNDIKLISTLPIKIIIYGAHFYAKKFLQRVLALLIHTNQNVSQIIFYVSQIILKKNSYCRVTIPSVLIGTVPFFFVLLFIHFIEH